MEGLLTDIKYLESIDISDDLELFLGVPHDNYHQIKRDIEYKANNPSLCKYRLCRTRAFSSVQHNGTITVRYKYCKTHLSMFHPELRCIVPDCNGIRVKRMNEFILCYKHHTNHKIRTKVHDDILHTMEHGCVIDGVQYDVYMQ